MTCDFNAFTQACYNYASVIDHNPNGYDHITCPFAKQKKTLRPVVNEYNVDRKTAWVKKIPPIPKKPNQSKGCQRDEWPPASLHEVNNGFEQEVPAAARGNGVRPVARAQFIRLVDGNDNSDAGQLWKGCPNKAESNVVMGPNTRTINGQNIVTHVVDAKVHYSRIVKKMEFRNKVYPDNDEGLSVNPCQLMNQKDDKGNPIDARGFALLNRDSWFIRNPKAVPYQVIWGSQPTKKRSLEAEFVDLDGTVAVGTNSSRRLTAEELEERGIQLCEEPGCQKEMEVLRIDLNEDDEDDDDTCTQDSSPTTVLAASTTLQTSQKTGSSTTIVGTPQRLVVSPHLPRQT